MKLYLLLLMLCININSYCQILNANFFGVWRLSYYCDNPITDTTKYTERMDEEKNGMYLLMNDGKGIFILNNCYKDFKWFIVKDTITFECAYNIPLIGKYNYSYNCDSVLLLKKAEMQITNKHIYMIKNNIKLKLLDDDSIKAIKYHQDKIYAFNNRIIKNQPPKIVIGNYDIEAKTLYLSSKDYTKGSIGIAKRYDQLELFVISNNGNKKNSIYSFLIIYNSNDNSILGTYYLKTYNFVRHYDNTRMRDTRASTHTSTATTAAATW